jgi:hypothetical protein
MTNGRPSAILPVVMVEPSNQSPPATEPSATKPDAAESIPPVMPADGKPVKQLSKEEQMAAFEEDLKYNDWGHQPC